MKAETLLLTLVGVGIAGYVGYTLASKRSEDIKKAVSSLGNVYEKVVEKVKEVPSIKEVVKEEKIVEKVKDFASDVSKLTDVYSYATGFATKTSDVINQTIQTVQKKTEDVKQATENLKQSAENVSQTITKIAETPKKVVEKIQPVVVPSVVGGVVGGPIGAIVGTTFYRVGWELGKATQNFGHWLIEKTGGKESPIVKASQIITAIFGKW